MDQRGPGTAEEIIARVERGFLGPAEALRLLDEVVPRAGAAPRQAAPAQAQRAPQRAPAAAAPVSVIERPGRPGPGPAQTGTVMAAGQDAELGRLVGLAKVKGHFREVEAFACIQARRQAVGLKAEPVVLHMIFRGNPGTGKTTVARLAGRFFHSLGLVEKGHVVEVERADLVGEYIGHTAQRTREQVKKALGGVLFVDEAYSLARGGEKDFGREAIDTMVKAMEDHRTNLAIVLAGYRDEMDWFLRQNPGLRSRFPTHLDFPDFTPEELLGIAQRMLLDRDYILTDQARRALSEVLGRPSWARAVATGNGRLVRNLVEQAVRRQAVRLMDSGAGGRDALMRIEAADLALGAPPPGVHGDAPAPSGNLTGGMPAWSPGGAWGGNWSRDGHGNGHGNGGRVVAAAGGEERL